MPKETELKKAAMIRAMEDALGVVTIACKTVGINRRTHYTWMADDPDYKKAIDDLQEVALDFAESQLHRSIRNGSDTATIFYLKTKGKKRGYIERQEVQHDGNGFKLNIIMPEGE